MYICLIIIFTKDLKITKFSYRHMDLSTPAGLLAFMQNQGYILIFLLIAIEGPIMTYVAAFAASLGFFNIYMIFAVSILANVFADLIYFGIGRLTKRKRIQKYVDHVLEPKKAKHIKDYLKNNPIKTLTLIKYSIAIPGLILTGSTDMSVKRFVFYSFMLTIPVYIIINLLGFCSGLAFSNIYKYVKYGEWLIPLLIISIGVAWFLSKKISAKLAEKIEK